MFFLPSYPVNLPTTLVIYLANSRSESESQVWNHSCRACYDPSLFPKLHYNKLNLIKTYNEIRKITFARTNQSADFAPHLDLLLLLFFSASNITNNEFELVVVQYCTRISPPLPLVFINLYCICQLV